MRARAPGKLVLSGAYAVLEGAPALVAAVDRYALADSERSATLRRFRVGRRIGAIVIPHTRLLSDSVCGSRKARRPCHGRGPDGVAGAPYYTRNGCSDGRNAACAGAIA